MLSRLGDNILLHVGINVLTSSSPQKKSWFSQVNHLCSQYSLPPALELLTNPCSKNIFKNNVKSAVIDYWERKLRSEAQVLSSLKYFKPQFYSLTRPHPIWTYAGTNPYEVEKAVVQAKMLSGRYRCEKLRRHWSSNTGGYCELEPCVSNNIVGSLEHMLLDCEGLSDSRAGVLSLWRDKLADQPNILSVVMKYTVSEPTNTMQFLLDCSVLPSVIQLSQSDGSDALNLIFYLTRTFCASLHKAKFKLLGII